MLIRVTVLSKLLLFCCPAFFLYACNSNAYIEVIGARVVDARPQSTIGPQIVNIEQDWLSVSVELGVSLPDKLKSSSSTFHAEFTDCNNTVIYTDEFYSNGYAIDQIRLGYVDTSKLMYREQLVAESYIPYSLYERRGDWCIRGVGGSMLGLKLSTPERRIGPVSR